MKLDEIKKELEQIQEQNKTKTEELNKAIANLESIKQQLLNGMTENLDKENNAAYIENRQELTRINTLLDYNSALLSNETVKPLITKQQYEEKQNEIIGYLSELKAETETELNNLMDNVRQIIADFNAEVTAGNDLLRVLQVDIYRDKTVINKKGFVMIPLVKAFNGYLNYKK